MKTEIFVSEVTILKSKAERCFALGISLLAMLALPSVGEAQFYYTTNNGSVAITGYTGSGGALVIPSTINGLEVTRIEPGAFSSQSSLTDITILNSVTNIGASAFEWCANLTNVTFPESVTRIGDWAFYGCASLSAIAVDTLNSIFSSVDGVLFNKNQINLVFNIG